MRIFKAETRALSGDKDTGQLPPTTAASSPSTEPGSTDRFP
jgi:hypothetical protein